MLSYRPFPQLKSLENRKKKNLPELKALAIDSKVQSWDRQFVKREDLKDIRFKKENNFT